jgi:hypothetical protein
MIEKRADGSRLMRLQVSVRSDRQAFAKFMDTRGTRTIALAIRLAAPT